MLFTRAWINVFGHCIIRQRLAGVSLALLSAAVLTAACRTSASRKASAPVASAPSAFSRLRPGDQLIYSLEYASTGSADIRTVFGPANSKQEASQENGATSVKTSLEAQLSSTVLDEQGDSVVIAVRLQTPVVRLEINGREAGEQAHTIAKDLNDVVFAIVDRTGRVRSVLFDRGSSGLSQGFERTLLALTQFVFPYDRTADLNQWEASEDGPAGQYVALYQAQGSTTLDKPVATFKKKKLRYLDSSEKSSANQYELDQVVTPSGALAARFDLAAGYIISLEGSESDVTAVAGKTVASSATMLKLTYRSQQTLSEHDLAGLRIERGERERTASPVPLFVKRSRQEIETSVAASELGKDTPESLLTALADAESAAAASFDDTSLFLKFKALVQLHPDSCEALGRALIKADPEGPSMRVLAGALKAAASPEAQNTLASVIRARGEDWLALSKLIPMLATAGTPTETAVSTLKEIANTSHNSDIVTTAELSLGIMARNLEKGSPERSARLVDSFIHGLDSSASPADKRRFLLVLGNAGSTRAIPVISRFLSDPSPALRAAAVSALRLCDSSQADDLLARALDSDPDPAVRAQAAFSLSYREMNAATLEVQRKVFQGDADERLRLSLLNNLWKARQSFPEVVQIVKRAAVADASKEVREAATRLLFTIQRDHQ